MAVTITAPQVQNGWLPSANHIVFSLSTDNIQSKLSYIIYVNINGNCVTQLKYPVYNRSNMNVDLHTIVNDFLEEKFCNDDSGPSGTPIEFNYLPETLQLTIDVEQEYYNGTEMIIDPSVSSDEIYVWISGADFQKAKDLPKFYDQFEPVNPDEGGRALGVRFLPSQPIGTYSGSDIILSDYFANNAYRVTSHSKGNFNFFTYQNHYTASYPAQQSFSLSVWAFGEDKLCTKHKLLSIAGYSSITATKYAKKIGICPFTIDELNALNWTSTIMYRGLINNIDPEEDKYYVIGIGGVDIDSYYDEFIYPIPFVIDCPGKYSEYSILYHTIEGGWWQVPATMKAYKSIDIESNVKFNNYGAQAMAKIGNDIRYKSVVHKEANGSITLNTDWISKKHLLQEYEDMIISDNVYLIETDLNTGDRKYIPVVMKDSSYDLKTVKNEKLVQYAFEFEEAYKITTLK